MTYSPQHRNKTAHELAGIGIYVFPCHVPLFDRDGHVHGCSCEHWRRSDECKTYKTSDSELARGLFNHKWLKPGEKCDDAGKHPIFGFKNISTIDGRKISEWFGRYSYTTDVETGEKVKYIPNIGIDCGKSDLLVLDADSYKDTYSGTGSALTKESEETPTVITGSGGNHYFYARQGKPYGNATGGLPSGVDIRGVGGYVVTVDSIHPSGNYYQWELDHSIFEIDLKPIPAELEKVLNEGKAQCVADAWHTNGITIPSESKVKRSVEIVDRIVRKHKLAVTEGKPYDGIGVIWKLYECPFNPEGAPHAEDRAAYIAVRANGAINAFCPHARCNDRMKEVCKELDSGASDMAGGDFKVSGWRTLLHILGEERITSDGWGLAPTDFAELTKSAPRRVSAFVGVNLASKPALRSGGWA